MAEGMKLSLAAKDYDRLSTCAVCTKQVVDHRVLPCQHMFCLTCLQSLVQGRNITCPTCRKVCQLEGRNVFSLPKNLFLLALLENICVNCRRRNKKFCCQHCDKWLCQKCYDICINEHKEQTLKKVTGLITIEGSNLKRIDEEILRFKSLVTKTLGQIDDCAKARLEAVERKQKKLRDQAESIKVHHDLLRHELLEKTDTESDRLEALREVICSNMSELEAVSMAVVTDAEQNKSSKVISGDLKNCTNVTEKVKPKEIIAAEIVFEPMPYANPDGHFGVISVERRSSVGGQKRTEAKKTAKRMSPFEFSPISDYSDLSD